MAMEKWASRTFSLCLLILFLMLTGGKGQQSQCEDRWFGDKCQYQCHCLKDAVCDNVTGECPDGCDVRWFGPQCQYWDAAYTTNGVALTDGDDHTCLSPKGGLSQNFNMSEDVMFTWMRFVTKIPKLFDHVNITFLSRSGNEVVRKSRMTIIYSSDTSFEIYGELQDRLNKIRLDFDSKETKKSFCSMQVSSGRNVAIKQHTSQSSDDNRYPSYTAEKAVDGRSNQWFDNGSCTVTDYEDSSYWTLNLSLPVTVNMYTLLSTIDKWGICKLRYFRLETYFETHKVQQYDETATVDQNSYDVYSVEASPITSVTLTVSKDRWPNSSYTCDSGFASLSFCEMQIYGDVVCDPGKWGRDCEKECNCENATDSCFVSTGMCPSGCKAGFHGPGCQEKCDATFYGQDCATSCSEMCINNTCHHMTGVCNNCPDGKQISMNCSEDCSPGFFGPRCANQCSEHCGGDGFCNNINGSCLHGCKPGYRSDNCEQVCDNNTYGEGCNKTCSVNCVGNATQEPDICEHVTGQCLLGCLPGYSGITCEEIASEPDEIKPTIVVIPIVLVLITVAALILGIWLWRRRKANTSKNGEPFHSSMEESTELATGIHVKPATNARQSSDHSCSEANPSDVAVEISEDNVNVYDNIQEMQVRFSQTAIPVESLGQYLASHKIDFFTEQFQKLPATGATTNDAESSVNKHKNRYKNILAYDHSRVRLKENAKKHQGDYYNANFIQGFDGAKFIAAQAPNKGVLADFIRMIWEQEVELVVMLTKVVEDGKAKCECYWPINDSTEVTYGEITVKLAATQVLADYTKRTLQLIKNDGQSHHVTHYHFTSWPDKGVPQTPWALVDFEQVVDYHYDTEKPLLVHCSAGVGRTGTFIALRNVLKEAKVTGYIDFYHTLVKMRQDRIFMIQTVEQYRFLHDAAQVALLCQDALMTSDGLDDRMKILMEVTETGETNMEKEFKMVCALVEKEQNSGSENCTPEYVNSVEIDQNFMTTVKNRFSNLLPKKEHRPKLAFDSENDYINAVLVPSMTKQEQQVLTQLPLHNTVEDFWRLVTQYSVSLIVAFDSDKQNQDKPVGDYLPTKNKPLVYDSFEISGEEVSLGAFWEKQKIVVEEKSGVKDSWVVQHIKCTKSKLDVKEWLLLIKELHSMAPLRNTRILYTCMNGADQSGFACVLSLLINRVEHDHFLTVPLVVGEIKFIRPEVIPNKDQYYSLYKILKWHHETSHVYINHTPDAVRKLTNSVKLHSKPGRFHLKTIVSGESEEMSPHESMPSETKAPAEGKPEVKDKTKSSTSQPDQTLSKKSQEHQNECGASESL